MSRTTTKAGDYYTDGAPRRKCGDCTLCCTVMGVTDLEPVKEAGVRCSHVCSRGCRIYQDRPTTCREFACVWVQGGLPKAMRPDKVAMVFTVTPDGEQIVGFWDPARPAAWRDNGVRDYLVRLGKARGHTVAMVGAPDPTNALVAYRYGADGEVKRPGS